MIIRPLSAQDGAAFRRLRLDALKRHPEAFGESLEHAARQDEAAFAARIAAALAPDAIFGAFVGEALVGAIGFYVQKGEKACHRGALWGVYVIPERRGAGVGRALLDHAINHARRHVEILELKVVVDNHAARHLYDGAGFVTYGIERDAIRTGGRSYDEELRALRM